MAAIINGFRKKDEVRVMNTRWGDAGITGPMHGGWNTQAVHSTQPALSEQPQVSPDLDRDLPPTPPHDNFEGQDGVFIVEDDDEIDGGTDKDSMTVTIPLPWKKKKASTHMRKVSNNNNVINQKFAPPRRMDVMTPLGTAEATAVPLPDSRVSSPVGRAATTSPVLAFSPAALFRTRLATPSLGDILSPVAEGFAKEGPTHRPTPVMSPLQYAQTIEADRPSTASSVRSNGRSEGLMGSTMSSQAIVTEQAPDFVRPPSRGIGSTACMRSSSRGPRASSRGSRVPSVEPFTRRAPSVEPLTRRAPSVEPGDRRAASVEPFGRRAPSVEPIRQRAPSVGPVFARAPSVEPIYPRAATADPIYQRAATAEPVYQRAPSVEPIYRRAPSVEPLRRRAPSIEAGAQRRDPSVDPVVRFQEPVEEPIVYRREPSVGPVDRRRDPSPVRRRAPSAEPTNRRAPSIGPSVDGRAVSREPRGRRGFSVEPVRGRFRSEDAYRHRHRREDSDSSANDASADSDSEFESEGRSRREGRFNRFEKSSRSSGRTYRRRSIASPITSPVNATFNVAEVAYESFQPVQYNGFVDPRMTMSAGPGLTRPTPPPASMIAPTPPPVMTSASPPPRAMSRNRGLYSDLRDDFSSVARDMHVTTNVPPVPHRLPSPVSHHQSVGIAAVLGQPQVVNYAQDISLPSTHYIPAAGYPRDRADQHRRDERDRAREDLVRKLEMERDTSYTSEPVTLNGNDSKTRKVYGGSSDARIESSAKTMVPSEEEIWG